MCTQRHSPCEGRDRIAWPGSCMPPRRPRTASEASGDAVSARGVTACGTRVRASPSAPACNLEAISTHVEAIRRRTQWQSAAIIGTHLVERARRFGHSGPNMAIIGTHLVERTRRFGHSGPNMAIIGTHLVERARRAIRVRHRLRRLPRMLRLVMICRVVRRNHLMSAVIRESEALGGSHLSTGHSDPKMAITCSEPLRRPSHRALWSKTFRSGGEQRNFAASCGRARQSEVRARYCGHVSPKIGKPRSRAAAISAAAAA